MNWLITGGCGFLGTAFVLRLLQQNNHSIRVLDNLSIGKREDLQLVADFVEIDSSELGNPPKGVELVVGDIMNQDLAIQVAQGCDVIVHFAANTGVGPSVDDPRADMRLGDVKRNFSDTSKAKQRLGWLPKVKLPEGLNKTVEYFVK